MGKRRDRWASSSSEDESGGGCGKKTSSKDRRGKDGGTKRKAPAEDELRAASAPASHESSAKPSLQLPPLHNPLRDGSRRVYECYERVRKVSEGTYGVVWLARDVNTREAVALKQIKFALEGDGEAGSGGGPSSTAFVAQQEEGQQRHCWRIRREGFPVSALREINVLMSLSHESIVTAKEMVVGDAPDQVFMVMDYYEFDLKEGIGRFDGPLFQGELKGIMAQILSAADHLHSRWYLHRDLKPSNILVHRSGRIALADFGLARRYEDPPRPLTLMVVTLWYRAPELLFGEERYSSPVDMWSVGCVFGELVGKDPILQGRGELDQVDQIFSLVGSPTEASWPGFGALPNAGLFRWKPRPPEGALLPQRFPVAAPVSGNRAFLDSNGYDLLRGLLALDPARRLTARAAMGHRYFSEGVAPATPRFFSSS